MCLEIDSSQCLFFCVGYLGRPFRPRSFLENTKALPFWSKVDWRFDAGESRTQSRGDSRLGLVDR